MSFKSQGTPRSGKHKRFQSGVPLDEGDPIIEGWLARESAVVERLLNKRYGALYPSTLVTYRKDSDESPSKVWSITKDVVLTPVRDQEYHLRHPKTSTLWAVAASAYDKVHWWGFTLTWTGVVGGEEKLNLAFETKDACEEWHMALTDVISKSASRIVRTISAASDASTTNTDHDGSRSSFAPDSRRLARDSITLDGMVSSSAPPRKTRAWASVLHINGISVYVEEQDEDGEGGAVMVSAVVRAPPVDVFRSLVQVRKTEGLGIFAGARTVEVIDANTQVIAQTWSGSGAFGGLCAPREMVLLRTWRKDEDGTYIVLYQSTNHMAARRATGWAWKKPVRVHVQAAGFTIAPLLPKYTVAGESQESLVTLVLKADLGGFLSGGSLPGRLLSPLSGGAVRSMLEPVVTSIVVLRDRVEQNRFVVRPLSTAVGMEADEGEASVGGRGRMMSRTTTMLVYKRPTEGAEPISPEQRRAAASIVLDGVAGHGAAATGAAAAITARALPAEGEEAGHERAAVDESWALEGTCPKEFWLSPGNCGFKLRGPNYLVDRKKILAAPPMFELLAVDLLELEEPMFDICKHLPSVRNSAAPFMFCVQMMVPSSPPVSVVCTWAAPMPIMGVPADQLIQQFEAEQGPCPDHVAAFFRAFTDFIQGDGTEADKHRNSKFKLIPNIAKGSWIIKQAVGTTPVILGQKLLTKYYRGANYFEVDVDIGANSVAASITNLVCGATKSLALDMAVLIEGQSSEHLPEQLLGTVRLDKLDLKTAAYFDESSMRVVKQV